MLSAPSFTSLFVTGFLLLFISILLITQYNAFYRLDFYRKTTILSLITIAIGVHGMIHLGLEMNYGFNPYRWF